MAAGYSTNPLFRKLGLKEGFRVRLIHAPLGYSSGIGDMYEKLIRYNRKAPDLDFIHFFPKSPDEMEQMLPDLKDQIRKNGMIWVSWRKGNHRITSGVTEAMIRQTALAIGLVDVKVCAIDEVWSGLKLVFRLKDR